MNRLLKSIACGILCTLTASCGTVQTTAPTPAPTEIIQNGIFYNSAAEVTIDGITTTAYDIGGRSSIDVLSLIDHGFSADYDEVEDASGKITKIIFLNKTGKDESLKKQEIENFIKTGDPIEIKVYVNGNYATIYDQDGTLCMMADVLGDSIHSSLKDYGVSEYYVGSRYDPDTGKVEIDTDLDKLPSPENVINKFKNENEIFTQEIVKEINCDGYKLLQKNVYYDHYRTRNEILRIDNSGKAMYIGALFSDVYGISDIDDLRFENGTICFSGKRNNKIEYFTASPDTGKITSNGTALSYDQKYSQLNAQWTSPASDGTIALIENNSKKRIIYLHFNGNVDYISTNITDGKEFQQVSDISLADSTLSFNGDGTNYLVNINTSGVITGSVVSGSKPLTLDGVTLPSYDINGKTALCAEELVNCGFTLKEEKGGINLIEQEIAENMMNTPSQGQSTLGNSEKTKFRVRINGMTVPSFECGARHYILVDDLCDFRTDYNTQWGYSDYNMRKESNGEQINISLFRLGGMKEGEFERLNNMVSNNEIELYTESYEKEAPYFGAKLEPECGIYAGMTGDGIIPAGNISCTLNYFEFDTYQTDLYLINRGFVENMDCMCVIPWNITDLSLVYENDTYIRKTLDNLKKYNKPMIIRFGAEMNVSQIGDMPAAYVNAFRKIADIIHSEYPQFAVMWSVNDLGGLNKPMEYYYPGDEYVDWVGISSFMKKHFNGQTDMSRDGNVYFMTGDFAYHTNALKNIISFMEEKSIRKPLAISEGGTVTSLNYTGGGEIKEWSKERMRNMYWYVAMRYPQVKIIDYFNRSTNAEPQSYDISSHEYLVDIFDEATTSGAYRQGYSSGPDFTFVTAAGRQYTQDTIPLYTYAYIPEGNNTEVSYSLDENLLSCQNDTIPYKCVLDTSQIADGMHTLKISAASSAGSIEKIYTLEKNNSAITIS